MNCRTCFGLIHTAICDFELYFLGIFKATVDPPSDRQGAGFQWPRTKPSASASNGFVVAALGDEGNA